MIFVTVGSELSFDRMLSVVDDWAATSGEDVFAQIGMSDFHPAHIRYQQFITAEEYRQSIIDSSAIIAHAGMGSILSALQYGKPILVMPRREKFHETRNDHQVATANRLKNRDGIYVAMDEGMLREQLQQISKLNAGEMLSPFASGELIATIRNFINE